MPVWPARDQAAASTTRDAAIQDALHELIERLEHE
jgi:hypothetical protein